MTRACVASRWVGIALSVALGTMAESAHADEASLAEASLAEAKAHFKAGVSFLSDPEAPRYEDAYAEFKQSYALSHSPTVLGNLGLCAMKLERDGEAIESYQRYLDEVKDVDKEERKQIEKDLETLRVSAARVDITVDGTASPGASIVDTRTPISGPSFTNGYPWTGTTLHLLVRPGQHVLKLRTNQGKALEWEFQATPGGRFSHTFAQSAEPPKTDSKLNRTNHALLGPALVVGVGAAGLAVGGILGGVTLSKVHGLERECPNGHCRASDAQSRIDTAHHFVRATDFTLLGGGLVAGAGVSWFVAMLIERNHDDKSATHPKTGSASSSNWHAGAVLGPSGGFATVEKAF